MKTRLPLNIAGLLVMATLLMGSMACQRPLTPEESCGFVRNKDQQRVSWSLAGLPIKLYIHESVPKEAYPSIEQAIGVYTQMFGREVFAIQSTNLGGPLEPQRDGRSVIYWMNTWESDRSNEQARTTIHMSGNTIYEADMRVNASAASNLHFHMFQTAGNVQGVDLKSLLVHEMGHMLGLDHTETQGSVMNTRLAENITRADLGAEDRRNISCEYN